MASVDSKIALDLRIRLNLDTTSAEKQIGLVTKMMFDRDIKRFNEPSTYELNKKTHGFFNLRGWHKRDKYIEPPRIGGCPFIIQEKKGSKEKILRIGHGNHYYVANKAEFVDAAGDIFFKVNGDILFFNDKSGAYHCPRDEHYLERRTANFLAIINSGLPMDRFRIFYNPAVTTGPDEESKQALLAALIKAGNAKSEAERLVRIASSPAPSIQENSNPEALDRLFSTPTSQLRTIKEGSEPVSGSAMQHITLTTGKSSRIVSIPGHSFRRSPISIHPQPAALTFSTATKRIESNAFLTNVPTTTATHSIAVASSTSSPAITTTELTSVLPFNASSTPTAAVNPTFTPALSAANARQSNVQLSQTANARNNNSTCCVIL